MAIGTCKTPAALMVSKNNPSDVLASPMVPKATSFPLMESPVASFNSGVLRYIFDANANPSKRGICPAVGEISADEFFRLVSSFQLPSRFTVVVA